jgi:hypothetical protein
VPRHALRPSFDPRRSRVSSPRRVGLPLRMFPRATGLRLRRTRRAGCSIDHTAATGWGNPLWRNQGGGRGAAGGEPRAGDIRQSGLPQTDAERGERPSKRRCALRQKQLR